eukprot:TRINITY_DN26446_c0_g1_i1.p2 TRINITY_DN26446_c0_g1~~TRINITY_DN26446_c0_g1_i1.p2  ORF type:complete len:311 (+),score=62.54 TRINITY_DN26446_c0_g1_i1:75-935(+)
MIYDKSARSLLQQDPGSLESLAQSWLELPLLSAVAAPALVWLALLLLVWLLPCCSFELKKQGADRLVATIHALVTAIWGSYIVLTRPPSCLPELWWERAPMLVLMGYLVVDLGSMLVCDVWKGWRAVDAGMLFHHIFILTMFSIGFAVDVGVWFAGTLLINEWSTPFFSLFWLLQHLGLKDSFAFTANGLAFVTVFFFCRMLFIPYSVLQLSRMSLCMDSPNERYKWAGPVMVVGYMALYVLNSLWFFKLVAGAYRKLFGKAAMPHCNANGYDRLQHDGDDSSRAR